MGARLAARTVAPACAAATPTPSTPEATPSPTCRGEPSPIASVSLATSLSIFLQCQLELGFAELGILGGGEIDQPVVQVSPAALSWS